MKKKLVTIAMAAAFTPAAALADVTIYGKLDMAVENNSGYTQTATTKQNGAEITSHNSRIGFKGTENLGDGLSAIFQIESQVNLAGNGSTGSVFGAARDSFVGLSGGFGTLSMGRLALGNQYVFDASFFVQQVGDSANFTGANALGGGRVSNAISYATPKMGGFTALVTYAPNTSQSTTVTNPTTKESSYTLRGAYADGPVTAGLTYQNIGTNNTAPDVTILSLGGKYNFGSGAVGAQYVRSSDIGQVAGVDQNVYTLGGMFKLSGNSAIKAQYANAGDRGGVANTGASMYALGYDYNFSKRTMGYVAYAKTSNDAGAAFRMNGWAHNSIAVPAAGDNPSAISIGLAHSF
jgi:predicted porin